jgi:isohexenylglutaconyl-CoA hydratase
VLASALHTSAADLVDDAAQVFARAVRGAEGIEGMAAFMQKRLPSWAPQ